MPAWRGAPRIKEAILIGSPGFGIYGHWIVDYLPRLNEIMARGQQQLPFHYHVIPGWAQDFASLILPGGLPEPVANGAGVTFFERLILPTSIRSGGVFDGAAAADRGRQERVLENAAEVETHLENLGFTVIHPQTLPLAGQHWLFSRARLVVAEYGSALHNTIFSPPGTRIGAISMGRINTLHAVVANALVQRITFIPTTAGGRISAGTVLYRLEMRDLKDALDRLLDGI